MLSYDAYHDIAYDVLARLDIPDELDAETAARLDAEYLVHNDGKIEQLVDEVISGYDTSDNHPADIEDLKKHAADEVFYTIDEAVSDYYDSIANAQESIINNAYASIVDLIRNSDIEGVVSVDAEYEPADSSVGLYHDERTITITLSTGATITMSVDFDD
jgi:hypothetical protein